MESNNAESGSPSIRFEGPDSSADLDILQMEEKTLRTARATFERQFILRMLSENAGNVSRTAQVIGVERSHLHRKMKAYGIEVPGGNA